jgi:hypothetical protein
MFSLLSHSWILADIKQSSVYRFLNKHLHSKEEPTSESESSIVLLFKDSAGVDSAKPFLHGYKDFKKIF